MYSKQINAREIEATKQISTNNQFVIIKSQFITTNSSSTSFFFFFDFPEFHSFQLRSLLCIFDDNHRNFELNFFFFFFFFYSI